MLSARVLRDRTERGAVAVMVGLLGTVMLLTAAFVVDFGFARSTKATSQASSDAASLAAANVLYPASGACTDTTDTTPPCYTDAVKAAKAYALQNFNVTAADWNTCVDPSHFYVPTGSTQCVSFTDDTFSASKVTTPNRVRVLTPVRSVYAGAGGLVGINHIDIQTGARALLNPGTARSCGLCVLGDVTSGLGNGEVTVSGGSVFINGNINTGPNGQITAAPAPPNTIGLGGTCSGNCSPAPAQNQPKIGDPYANTITFPLNYGTLTAKTNPCTQGPGIYPALTIPNGTCTLQKGVYVLTGLWTYQSNNAKLVGDGVMLYGTCGTTAAPSKCNAGGQLGGGLDGKNGDTQLVALTAAQAPSYTGAIAGMAVIYDRNNTQILSLQGNGDSFTTGAIYAASSEMQFPGNSEFTVTNGPVIIGSMYSNGNKAAMKLTSVGGATIPAPPAGAALDQ